MKEEKLYLVDATAFCYRAFYALKGLSTSFGQPTAAIYGFVKMLNKILKEHHPNYVAVCFDVSRDTFRSRMFQEYKIQRPPMPDALHSQIPYIKKIVGYYGIKILEEAGLEADDIIAALVEKFKHLPLTIVVVSSDKDILQLAEDRRVVVFSPYKESGTLYDETKVRERFGISPSQIVDVIALMGDDVDNLPGVKGIGEKTARELIQRFGCVEKLLAEIDSLQNPKLRQSLQENKSRILFTKELAQLKKDIKIDVALEDLRLGQPDNTELYRLFKHLEFRTLLGQLEIDKADSALIRKLSQIRQDVDLAQLAGKKPECLFIISTTENRLVMGEDENRFFAVFPSEKDGLLKKLLEDKTIKKIGYNLKEIKTQLSAHNIALEGLYFDVMLASYLLNPARSDYSLNQLVIDYLDAALPASDFSPAYLYLCLHQLYHYLQRQLQEKDLGNLFWQLEMPLLEVLAEMEKRGVKIDVKVLNELKEDIQRRLAKITQQIYTLSAGEFNLNSPKQLAEVLFSRLGLPAGKKGKSGFSTSEEVLRKLAHLHPLPSLILEYRQLAKLENTYLDPIFARLDKENRLHTCFNQVGTETGRLSSLNPNLQNIPIRTELGRQLRRAIVAENDHYCLVACDYSQIELRILAHLSKDEALISAFRNNKDVHVFTASLIYGVEEKDVTEQMRDVAKRVNFGIIYGLSAFGLAQDLGISLEEAQLFIDTYFNRYSRVKEYISRQIERGQQEGFVTTLFGRRRYLPYISSSNIQLRQFAQRQAVNTPVQGSAADIIKAAMIGIHKKIKEVGLDAYMVLQVHDELLFEVSHRDADKLIAIAKEGMEKVITLEVPLVVKIKKGQNWLETEEVK